VIANPDPERSSTADELEPCAAVSVTPTPEGVADALRNGISLPDRVFDQFLPTELRVVSSQYWTPLAVARRAAQWLDEFDVHTVLDIGSGSGKFCVAAALAGRCRFAGLEQRARLVAASRALAGIFGVHDRASFIHGMLGESPLPSVEAYYLYNPFDEAAFDPSDRLDDEIDVSHSRRIRDIVAVQDLLRQANVGTYVLTYNGFGGNVPPGYRELRVDLGMPQVLRLWKKVTSGPDRQLHRQARPWAKAA